MNKIQNYINGNLCNDSKEFIEVEDPSKGEVISQVVNSNSIDFKLAIDTALKSQKIWAETTPLKRSRILSNYKSLIEKNLDRLAKIISIEHGKTLEDAKGSV